MATMQVVDKDGNTHAARRVFINGSQVYPPLQTVTSGMYNSYMIPTSAKVDDLAEGQLLIESLS